MSESDSTRLDSTKLTCRLQMQRLWRPTNPSTSRQTIWQRAQRERERETMRHREFCLARLGRKFSSDVSPRVSSVGESL